MSISLSFPFNILVYLPIVAFALVTGSFLNICIYRIPKKETLITAASYCVMCNNRLCWYDRIPVFSWMALKGRCKKCGGKISIQYPVVEAGNALLWVLTFAICGFQFRSVLYCLAISALLVLSLIDMRTFEIPFSCNVFLCILGGIATVFDFRHLVSHMTGFFLVAGLLLLVYFLTAGRGIGGGDIKLMAATGMLLGFSYNLVGFLAGCVYACIIHIARMKLSGEKSMLAMGPYLAAGTLTAMWFGEGIVDWYLNMFG